MEDDCLEGECAYPNMDCVGSAYFLRDKILSTLKTFDEESNFQIYAFADDSNPQVRKLNGNVMPTSHRQEMHQFSRRR